MIIEIEQLISLFTNHTFHTLIFYFLIFVVVPVCIVKYQSRFYRYFVGKTHPVTAIVPVYKEDPELFKQCLASIQKQHPQKLIVSIDSNDEELINTAKSFNAEVICFDHRVGKRKALADAWLKASTEFVVQVDSDTVLSDNCLSEITKPFDDKKVLGVAVRHIPVPSKSRVSSTFSKTIEESYNVNSQALNGGLIVADGRCNAWRTSFLLEVRDKFLSETWMNQPCQIGDDRFLSREALKAGGKTVYQDTAKIYTQAQPSLKNFLKQQLRWRRSGTKFWLKDIQEKVAPSKLYTFKCATYYLAPFAFLTALLLDALLFPQSLFAIPLYLIPVTIILGTALISLFRQLVYFGKPITGWAILYQGVLGLFIMLPLAIYGSATLHKQNTWGTRGYKEKQAGIAGGIFSLINILKILLFLPSLFASIFWWIILGDVDIHYC